MKELIPKSTKKKKMKVEGSVSDENLIAKKIS